MKRLAARGSLLLAPLAFSLASATSALAVPAPPPSVAALFDPASLEPPIVVPLAGCAAAASPEEVCGILLRALHELRGGRAAEAAADALRAVGMTRDGANAPALADAARLLRAEGLARAGRVDAAQAILEGLARGQHPELRAVAALRLADLDLDAGNARAAAAAYAEALPAALEVLGERASAWRVRAAEAALLAGDPVAARVWLEAARSSPGGVEAAGEAGVALEIRLGDTLAAEGRIQEAESIFRRIAASGATTPGGRTARLRLAGLATDSTAESRNVLAAELGAPEPAVAVYAATLLARSRLGRGDGQGALAALERVPGTAPSRELEATVRSILAAALREVVGSPSDASGCLRTLSRGGGSLVSLARRAGADDVLATAEECAGKLGLSDTMKRQVDLRGREAPREAWPGLVAAEHTTARARQALAVSGFPPIR